MTDYAEVLMDHRQEEKLIEKSTTARMKILDESDEQLTSGMLRKGLAVLAQRRWRDGANIFLDILKTYKEKPGDESLVVLEAFRGLAHAYEMIDKLQQAEDILLQVLNAC